jgi:hypothetical protein
MRHATTRAGRRIASSRRRIAAAALAAITLVGTTPARAEEPESPADETSTWWLRYETARKRLLNGEYLRAAEELRELAESAPTKKERDLVLDLAEVAERWSLRADGSEEPSPGLRRLRTTDEITMLYATTFIYGVGSGAWFLLQVQPDSALSAMLPFAGIAAAPVLTVALVDGIRPFSRGVPHAVSAGLYLGVGQGTWIVGAQWGRAHRLGSVATDRWDPETVSTVLWTSATLGGVAAGTLAAVLPTTPGRISYAASTTIWSGLLTGFVTAAVAPSYQNESAPIAAGIGYNAGLVGGLMSAGAVSPSVARVRLTDLAGVMGGLATGGLYLSLAQRDASPRATFALTSAGIAAGLAAGWLLTRNMTPELPEVATPPRVVWTPMFTPTTGGATLGIGGSY